MNSIYVRKGDVFYAVIAEASEFCWQIAHYVLQYLRLCRNTNEVSSVKMPQLKNFLCRPEFLVLVTFSP